MPSHRIRNILTISGLAILAVVAASSLAYVIIKKHPKQTLRDEALSAYNSKDYAKAEQKLQQEASADPQNASTYNVLGNVSRDKGDNDAAISYYEKAIATDPSLIDPYVNLSYLYINLGKQDQAKTTVAAGLKISPDDKRLAALTKELTP